jgi:hypothetical protein
MGQDRDQKKPCLITDLWETTRKTLPQYQERHTDKKSVEDSQVKSIFMSFLPLVLPSLISYSNSGRPREAAEKDTVWRSERKVQAVLGIPCPHDSNQFSPFRPERNGIYRRNKVEILHWDLSGT